MAVVVFRVESEWMALGAGLFAEIVDDMSIHTLPHRKTPILLGLVNVHGEIQLCVSLKHLMNLEEAPAPKQGAEKSQKAVDGGVEGWRTMGISG